MANTQADDGGAATAMDGDIDPPVPSEDAGREGAMDAVASDATHLTDAPTVPDAATTLDAELREDAQPVDGSSRVDAEAPDADDADTGNDADSDSDAQPSVECSAEDLTRWRTFQLSDRLLPAVVACAERDPRCLVAACDLSACLRESAQVTSCVACAAVETRCTAEACMADCNVSDTNDACRACACRNGCMDGALSCGAGTVDPCADCSDEACSNLSLGAALISSLTMIPLTP